MGIVPGLWLVLLGILGAADFIISRKPEAEKMLAKITPYQGWIGFISMWWGIWLAFKSISDLVLVKTSPGHGAIVFFTGCIMFLLGVLLGVSIFTSFIKHPRIVEKYNRLVLRVSRFRAILGGISVALGLGFVFS